MVTLQDIFDELETGELSQFAFSGDLDAPMGIDVENYPTLIRHTNRALMNLFTRFCLKEKEVAIDTFDEISFYVLDYKYAQSNVDSTEPTKWIADTPEQPFMDDIIRIQEVYDENGKALPMNDIHDEYSVFLPNYKTLQVPYPANDETLFVTYRAKHPVIDVNSTDLSLIEVDIPDYCIEPLLTYIAYRVYSASADQIQQGIAASMYAKYDLQCKELEDKNVLHNTPNDTNIKLEKGGWV